MTARVVADDRCPIETQGSDMDASTPPPPLIPEGQWQDFVQWANDGGYDQSYFDRWDSKSLALQQTYLDEMEETRMENTR
jgi:hypothetical protein